MVSLYIFIIVTVSARPRKMIKFGILLFALFSAMTDIEATSRRYTDESEYSSSGNGNEDYKDALSKSILFLEGQRSGVLPPNQRLTWRKDSALKDKSDQNVDLVGGYYDAGDNVKIGFPMAFTTTMLAWSMVEFSDSMGEERENAKAAIRWATDYFLKATANPGKIFMQVGNPNSDHNCWERPKDMDTPRTVNSIDAQNPGSDVPSETAAVMATASIVFQTSDLAYSQRLFHTATQLLAFADRYRGAYNDSLRSIFFPFYCDYSEYQDELLWAAASLHKASTNDSFYIHYIQDNGKTPEANDGIDEFSWENKHARINLLLSKDYLLENILFLESYQKHADSYICYLLPETSYVHVQYTPGGLIYKSKTNNMPSVTSISFLDLAYAKYLSDVSKATRCGSIEATPARLRTFAKRQIDYILGDNPLNMSYMMGYGSRFPQRIHHRASSLPSVADHPDFIACKNGFYYLNSNDPNPNLLIGAVVGGPDKNDQFPEDRANFRESEPMMYINTPLVGALAFFSANPS